MKHVETRDEADALLDLAAVHIFNAFDMGDPELTPQVWRRLLLEAADLLSTSEQGMVR